MAEKLLEAITVKLCEEKKRFVESRAEQLGMNAGSYLRSLIDYDQQKARLDFNLLADALGIQINRENQDSGNYVHQRTEGGDL